MPLRAADVVAVLDVLGLERAHFIGTSWGGCLCFGIGEHAPERVFSLTAGGQQPYAIDPDGPLTRAVGEGILAAQPRRFRMQGSFRWRRVITSASISSTTG